MQYQDQVGLCVPKKLVRTCPSQPPVSALPTADTVFCNKEVAATWGIQSPRIATASDCWCVSEPSGKCARTKSPMRRLLGGLGMNIGGGSNGTCHSACEAPSDPVDSSHHKSSSLSTGAIVGIAVACGVVLIIVIALGVIYGKKRRA